MKKQGNHTNSPWNGPNIKIQQIRILKLFLIKKKVICILESKCAQAGEGERDGGRGSEREGERGTDRASTHIPNRIHAQCRAWSHRSRHRAWSHNPVIMTWAEIESPTLNRLSYPGIPADNNCKASIITMLKNINKNVLIK